MPLLPSTIDACRIDLFTDKDELEKKYTDMMVARIIRLREAYTFMLANPSVKDKVVVDHILQVNKDIKKTAAYNDLDVLKQLLPALSQNSRDFHRWRYNEMILETFDRAKRHNDTKTMERAASSYAKYNRIDQEDEMAMPYDMIVVQPFVPTTDVSVLGLKPMKNAYEAIDKLTKELLRDMPDVQDVEFEEADLEEEKLFARRPEQNIGNE